MIARGTGGGDTGRSRGTDDRPLIALSDLRKIYRGGGSASVEVLRGVSLTIQAGEFIALIGQSGSGKSTLMNILGMLDQPTSGVYRFEGKDVRSLSRDQLARLRRDAFGFIFQQYNLISTITAAENVAVPVIYAGRGFDEGLRQAEELLGGLGLGGRTSHRPNELSGGQQQRVSIARALVNGGRIILADEPTGALDTVNGAQVIQLLSQLARDGHTVILVTHDRTVASAADRIIEISDGVIVSDSRREKVAADEDRAGLDIPECKWTEDDMPDRRGAFLSGMKEAMLSGGRALLATPVRTTLTLMGIIIGVASVIALLAIGEGAKHAVLAQLSVYGANRLYVIPGGESSRGPGGRLLEVDADLVRGLPNIAAAMPYLHGSVTVRAGNVDYSTRAVAVTSDFPRILNWPAETGVFFTKDDERAIATVAVIGKKLADRLFASGSDPIRKMILINNVPFQIIGILAGKGALSGDSDDDDTIVFPFSTGSRRVGKSELSWISVLVSDLGRSKETEALIAAELEAAHRTRDFRVYNKAASIEAQDKTQNALTLLLGFTAAISLFVGGIGIVNVMLMAVTERTREIGIRIAIGARTGDILRQFLTEAVLVAGAGGVVGAVAGIACGVAVSVLFKMPVIFSTTAIVASFLCAMLTGFTFGFMPALRAARLDPVAALARE